MSNYTELLPRDWLFEVLVLIISWTGVSKVAGDCVIKYIDSMPNAETVIFESFQFFSTVEVLWQLQYVYLWVLICISTCNCQLLIGWTSSDSQLSDENRLHATVPAAGWATQKAEFIRGGGAQGNLSCITLKFVLCLRVLRRNRACAAVLAEKRDSHEVTSLPWPTLLVLTSSQFFFDVKAQH